MRDDETADLVVIGTDLNQLEPIGRAVPSGAVGRLLFNVLAMVAEFEADLIRARTREGMAVARAKGRLRGKSPKLNPRQEAHLVALHDAREHTIGELAELFGVGRATVYRAVDRARARARSSA